MAYNYTPAYYSTLHDSITSLCKTILPFSFKKRGRLAAAEHRINKIQSDNLKWQQDSFHQILNLTGLHKAGILEQHEVSAFRSHLLETLIASPTEHEHAAVLRDKLLFLQELLYAKCITEEEYHSSKGPLMQRMAVQGAEIEARDVVVGGKQSEVDENRDEEWSVIDLRDEKRESTPQSKRKSKEQSSPALKQIKGAGSSLFGFNKQSNRRQSIFEIEAKRPSCGQHNNNSGEMYESPIVNGGNSVKGSETKSILMQASGKTAASPRKENGSGEKVKRKPFRTLFDKEQSSVKSAKKKQWWKRNDSEDETAPLPLNIGRAGDCEDDYGNLVTSPIGEGPDTKQIKRKLHSDGTPSDFFIDKVLGNNIKKELFRIQTELSTTNPNLKLSDDQMEAISTKLPVDKADLKNFFPKSWCDQYGDVVKKEFKDHVGEMENMRNATREKHLNNSKRWTTFSDDDDHVGEIESMKNVTREKNLNNSKRWTTFDEDDDENIHPNLFSSLTYSNNINKSNNPFLQDSSITGKSHHWIEKPQSLSTSFQNPFWNGSSLFH
ncbi:unnamed protein product [Linum tenue]|uniref:Uncharacterized protein n=1 Tax=Linum tenue TaxID=586396 RepID=A0AAV0QDY3_9ROSI|nr:unnamed protein product [Linum tenue]